MPDLVSIVYKPENQSDPADHYLRVPLQTAQLLVGQGIEGDAKGRAAQRQLNVMTWETVEQLRAEGYKTAPGELGEQLVLRGVDVATLAAGTRLGLGPTAQIEIIKFRTGCDRFEHIQGFARARSAHRIGIIATVVASGPIRVGDPVVVLQPAVAEPA